jgi:ATP-dependent Clp protease ATP-binding subunit ClpC
MPDSDRLTHDSLRAFWWAQVEACGRHDGFCGIADLLCGIALSRESITSEFLSKAGITTHAVRSAIAPTADKPPPVEEDIPLTPNVKKTFNLAFEVADELGHQKVDCGHILYSLLNEPMVEDLREILHTLKVDPEQLRAELFLRLRDTGRA